MKDSWIAAIARGHNGGVCLLKNGKVVFSIEEERLTRFKYDGGPYASMIKIKDFTDKLDYLVIAHTTHKDDGTAKVDFTGEDVYTGIARKLNLIDRKAPLANHPQVIDLSHIHHKLHAACAFYRSGFKRAAGLVVDGAGTFVPLEAGKDQIVGWEVESIFDCAYPNTFKTVYKHLGLRGPTVGEIIKEMPNSQYGEPETDTHECVISDRAGITKTYEAVTEYCGWFVIEAGKTMGLSPYGKPNDKIPKLFETDSIYPLSNRNLIVPTYPNGARVNYRLFDYLDGPHSGDLTLLENRRDMAYAVQAETQDQVVQLIKKASKMTGHKKVVISGGYGLNCVANYHYLEALKEDGIEIYVEPISNDAGTAMGAAMLVYKDLFPESKIDYSKDGVYLGFEHHYSDADFEKLQAEYGFDIKDASHNDVVDLLTSKNIVTLYQGRSENGPRALGNRSVLFNPAYEDGKDFVNSVKRREYFRPFAGSILQDHVHDWFDLRGMDDSPHMMYAVNCKDGVAEKIPSIIHVDGTCRIQTVTQEQNKHYYDLIKCFYDRTGIPILFNTSFNLGGDPLVETLEDAIETLAKSDIEYMYLPEYGKLVYVKN